MGKFFNCLVSENLINDWASTLDWLFDDLKFSAERNWNGGYLSLYAKKLKTTKYMSDKEKRFKRGKCETSDFPNQCNPKRRKRLPYIAMLSGNSLARDLIRHIRNGIAHGETTVTKVGEELYIEIIDYSGKTKKSDKQTAYLFIPLSYINEFFKKYDEINKSIMNTTKKDQDAAKKFRKKEQ